MSNWTKARAATVKVTPGDTNAGKDGMQCLT